jgi:hypothetical protein
MIEAEITHHTANIKNKMTNIVKTFLDTNDQEFNYKPVIIHGDDFLLITPKTMATNWNDLNCNFRSAVVNPITFQTVSLSFKKFVNFSERPEFQPWDNDWKFTAFHKLDGSLLIVSKYKGKHIIRTRGTTDARQMANGDEIDFLIKKYPLAFDNAFLNAETASFLFEWTTPSNIICLREHNEPTLTLIGAIRHSDYEYLDPDTLDFVGGHIKVDRPERFKFNSIHDCIADVTLWRGKEGVVIISPDGQTLKKIKSAEYCQLHKLATGIKNINQVLDVFLASPKFTTVEDFYKYVETTLDYEIAEKIKDDMVPIVEAYNSYLKKVERVKNVVKLVKDIETRKEQAQIIQQDLHGWQHGHAFTLLDNRELSDKMVENAVKAELEKVLNK